MAKHRPQLRGTIMHVTLVHVQIKPEHVDAFIDACRDNHRTSIREAGNLRFDIPTTRAASFSTKPMPMPKVDAS